MRALWALATLAALAACGVDGAPTAPGAEPGMSVSGQVKVGIAGS